MQDVKQLREQHGLSREQFCEVFNIPYRTLQSWELGVRRCPEYVFQMMDMLLKLAARHGALEAFRKGEKNGD